MNSLEVDAASGRQHELKILLQALNLVRQGKAATFLILGDSGIGKSSLLNSVAARLQHGNFTRCFDFRALHWTTLPVVYQQMMTILIRDCETVLDQAAATATHHGREMGLSWERHDLLQLLVKARQNAGVPALGLEIQDVEGFRVELVKQVKSLLPLTAKLGFNVPPAIDNVAESLIHPWILIAMSFLAPEQSEFRQALDLSERVVKHRNHQAEVATADVASAYIAGMKVVLTRINRALKGWDAGAIFLFDGWEQMRDPALKDFFADLLFHLNASKQACHVMAVAACETSGLSYSLGGNLFEAFQHTILLGPLDEMQIEQWVEANISDHGLRLPADLAGPLFHLSRGNPYWVRKILAFLHSRLSAGQRPTGQAAEWLESLGLLRAEDVLALQFTQLKLQFLGQEESLLQVTGGLISRFAEEPFQLTQAIRQLAQGLNLEDPLVRDILDALVSAQFIKPSEADRSGWYQLDGKPVLDYLAEQTRAIMFTDFAREQVGYLKKVLPLSIQSGELTREKTREVLTLCNTFDDKTLLHEMEDLLQTGFLEALSDEILPVRIAALNALSLFETDQARTAIIHALDDRDAVVREYAVRNLGEMLTGHPPATRVLLTQMVVTALQARIQETNDAVRLQIMRVLAEAHALMPYVGVALLDDVPEIRRLGLQQLYGLDAVAAETSLAAPENQRALSQAFQQAVRDTNPDIRREACLVLRGLSALTQWELVSHMPEWLIHCAMMDEVMDVRVAAVEALSLFSSDPVVWRALIGILDNSTHAQSEAIEPLQMAVLRVLGKHKSATSERALCDFIDATLLHRRRMVDGPSADGLLWLAIRGLGRIGRSHESIRILETAQAELDNPLITPMLEAALVSISRRLHLQSQGQSQAQALPAYTVQTVYPAQTVYTEQTELFQKNTGVGCVATVPDA